MTFHPCPTPPASDIYTGVSLRIVRGNLVVPEMATCFHAAAVLEWDRGSSGIEVCDLQSNCVWVHVLWQMAVKTLLLAIYSCKNLRDTLL